MKINYKSKILHELEFGTCFEFNETLYLKIKKTEPFPQDNLIACLNFNKNIVEFISPETLVYPVNANINVL